MGQWSFNFLKVIGKGGYSTVLKGHGNVARKKDTGALYAIKAMSKHQLLAEDKVSQVTTELSILAQVNHPFIISLHYAFQSVLATQTSYIFLALDFCPGGELFYLLQKQGSFSEEQAKFYFAEVVLGMEYLHQQNILYRDLKPENVLIDAEGHICLTDFGVSKERVFPNSIRRSFCGSPEYMSPEMLRKIGHTRAIDFYSLGALLYEMLTGMPPFPDQSRANMYKRIQNEQLRFPTHLSASVCDLISRLMHKNPLMRMGTRQGIIEVKEHQWCADVQWDRVLTKSMEPPFVPSMRRSNFDPEYTSLPVEFPEVDATEADYGTFATEVSEDRFYGFEYPKCENLMETSSSFINQVPKARSQRNDLSILSTTSTKAAEVAPTEKGIGIRRMDTLYIPELEWRGRNHVCHSSVEVSKGRCKLRLESPVQRLFTQMSDSGVEEALTGLPMALREQKSALGPVCSAVKLAPKNIRPGGRSDSPSDSFDLDPSDAHYETSP